MRRALDLAERGRGRTSPNPMVGCVVVSGGEVVGEGWHPFAGGPHAEAAALSAAGGRARGATVYVTLEPCDHHGRTPPCTEALIGAGVREVVVAHVDPDERVAGRGIERLRAAGIEVRVGVLAERAEALNAAYLTSRRLRRPYVVYKSALSLDGKTATSAGESLWITGPEARAHVHGLRDELDAVAVGSGTVLADDPRLTARGEGQRTPLKVVFDARLRTPPSARLLSPSEDGERARVVVYTAGSSPERERRDLEEAGAEVVPVPDVRGTVDVAAALSDLADRGVTSVLLEGGPTLAWGFFEAKAVDEVAWFLAPRVFGGGASGPVAGPGFPTITGAVELGPLKVRRFGDDLLVSAAVVRREES